MSWRSWCCFTRALSRRQSRPRCRFTRLLRSLSSLRVLRRAFINQTALHSAVPLGAGSTLNAHEAQILADFLKVALLDPSRSSRGRFAKEILNVLKKDTTTNMVMGARGTRRRVRVRRLQHRPGRKEGQQRECEVRAGAGRRVWAIK